MAETSRPPTGHRARSGPLRAGGRAATLGVAALCVLAGCGQGGSGSRSEAARTYVDSVQARNWEAACDVSVARDDPACAALLRGAYAGRASSPAPTVEETERTVERVGSRFLVHFELQVVR